MTIDLVIRASLIWLLIAVLAIVNGIFRESLLVPLIGHSAALPVSGISLSSIIFIVTYFVFPMFGKRSFQTYFFIGLQWVLMTLIFELVFGHYIIGKPWPVIFEVFNVYQGNLFVIVLLTSLFSPFIVAKIKSIV